MQDVLFLMKEPFSVIIYSQTESTGSRCCRSQMGSTIGTKQPRHHQVLPGGVRPNAGNQSNYNILQRRTTVPQLEIQGHRLSPKMKSVYGTEAGRNSGTKKGSCPSEALKVTKQLLVKEASTTATKTSNRKLLRSPVGMHLNGNTTSTARGTYAPCTTHLPCCCWH